MTIAAGGKIKRHTRFYRKAARWGLTWAAVIIAAPQVCFGADIYRWVDAEGKTHFSDTPPSAGDAAPLRAFEPARASRDLSDLPENHYSVLNQARRMEVYRLERRESRAASTSRPGPVQGERGYRGNRSGGVVVDNLDPLADGVYSTLGPRTDLTKFPPPGHPVYSPTLGFPPNDYYHHYKSRRYPRTRLSLPLSRSFGGKGRVRYRPGRP